ncbi:MAG: NAD-dependent deacylase [Phycisphaerales bacterium]
MSARRPIVILTGAGISAESGIATFRGAGGLWEGHAIEDVASPAGFRRNPALVHRFYSERREALEHSAVRPNAAHEALVELASRWPAPVRVITQNVDDLLERAGLGERAGELLHMHGELRKVRNVRSGRVHPWSGWCDAESIDPETGEVGVLRPHIVWFGEEVLGGDTIARWLDDCGLFLAIGTQGAVWPAAGFVHEAKSRGAREAVEFNLARTDISSYFDRSILGPAGTTVPAFVGELLGDESPRADVRAAR